MGPDCPVRNGEAQPGASFFEGDKGLKDMIQLFLTDAAAGIPDGDDNFR